MPVPEGCPWGYEDFFVMLSSRGLEEVENEGCLSCYPHLLLVALGLGAKQLLLEAPHLPWSRWHEVKKLKLSRFGMKIAFFCVQKCPAFWLKKKSNLIKLLYFVEKVNLTRLPFQRPASLRQGLAREIAWREASRFQLTLLSLNPGKST